jgi:hypothetical protein
MPLSKIPANGISSIANTAISGNVISSQITSVANTQITGLLTTAQLSNTFVEAAVATNFTGKQTFTGTSSVMSSKFINTLETTTVNTSTWNSTANTINYDITTQSILYYTSNCANNFTVNFRASSGTTLNSAMAIGETVTAVLLNTQLSANTFYNTNVNVDGTTSGVSTRWLGGSPTAGNAGGIDSYSYSITKTAQATFNVLASLAQYKV